MIKYTLSIPHPSSHFIDIEMKLDKINEPVVNLFLPAWRPGRYELGNFSKNIKAWKAFDGKGNELPFNKTTKDCWEVITNKNKEITIRYSYYGNVLNAGSCWLDEQQLYVNGIHCFMYDPNRINEACEVKLNIPASWKIACGLPEKNKHILASKDYHHLVDSPFIASPTLKHKRYEVDKTHFNIWIQGECKPDWEHIISDFKNFTHEQLSLFGEIPVSEYNFLIQVLPFEYYHGVEHTNSTVLALGPGYNLMQKDLYHEFIGVACHELFHTWNIKTIRPKQMLPYDYQKENYSELGYIYEGVTTYYGDYLLARCGIYSKLEFLDEMSKRLQNHMDNAGRFNYSVAESSFDTWLDGYVPGIPGRKTSIYDEGCLFALMLDLLIRKDTDGKKSLDDLLRTMNKLFGNLKKGYTEDDLIKILNGITGKSYADFFENYAHKPVSYDKELKKILSLAGCEIIRYDALKSFEHYYGFKVTEERSGTKISKIYPGSVAFQAGLFADDELICINGMKVENNLDNWFRYFENDSVELEVFSNKQKRKITLEKGKEKYYSVYKITRSKKTTKGQDKFFEKWVGK